MIRNLNPVSFQQFGTVLSERSGKGKPRDKWLQQQRELTAGNSDETCQTTSQTRLWTLEGLTVLSVSLDNQSYQHFYLDKTVSLREGVYFSTRPFVDTSRVALSFQTEPRNMPPRQGESLRQDHQSWVEGIYTFFYQEKEQGFLFPGEAHPMPELTYVDQGELHSVVEGKDLVLKQGDIVLYGPNQWHMQFADIGVAPRFVTISFDVGGADLTPLLNRSFTAPQHVAALLQNMLREQENMDSFATDIILSQLNLILLYLLREAANPSGRKLRSSNAVHSENEIIRQAQQFISANIRQKLSVPLVASQVDVSPSYLTALFHKNLQISPGEYIRRIKLQESKQMIRENDMNFTQIAAALQYSTVHHFSRQFKDKFGITPSEYARSVR